MWSNRIELIETCFLTKASIVVRHYSVTLGESNEYFTSDDSVSGYAKYVSGNAVWERRNQWSRHY